MPASVQPTAEEMEKFNEQIRYVGYSVFAITAELGEQGRAALAEDLTHQIVGLMDQGIMVRGIYDVSAFRADAGVMSWWHSHVSDELSHGHPDRLTTNVEYTISAARFHDIVARLLPQGVSPEIRGRSFACSMLP